jgi:nitroimidazol reductase NimA-like FMN-containing flavoprotein (pyridoxamine 5'-phosphate oxidase superfamily)
MISELDRESAVELLRSGRIGRLACIIDGEPYVVPISFVYDADCALIHSLPGRKIEAMRANPRVCLQVDEIESELEWKSVLAYGTYEEISDYDERAAGIGRLLGRFPALTPVESQIACDAGAPLPILFRIRVDKITGLFER